jgi:hypothetical protein
LAFAAGTVRRRASGGNGFQSHAFLFCYGVDRRPGRCPPTLELANKQVADSHRRVEAQVGLVARLARGGHDTFQARMLLGQFETSLALQVEARDCIVQELGESN